MPLSPKWLCVLALMLATLLARSQPLSVTGGTTTLGGANGPISYGRMQVGKFLVIGDSLSAGATGWWNVLTNQYLSPTLTTNFAAGTWGLSQIESNLSLAISPNVGWVLQQPLGSNDLAAVWIGANDYGAATPISNYEPRLTQYWNAIRTNGTKLMVFTIMPRTIYYGNQGETNRFLINDFIRHGTNWDYLVDVDALFSDPLDPLWSDGGGVHLSVAGQARLEQEVERVLAAGAKKSEARPRYVEQSGTNVNLFINNGISVMSLDTSNAFLPGSITLGSLVPITPSSGLGLLQWSVDILFPANGGMKLTDASTPTTHLFITPTTISANTALTIASTNFISFYDTTDRLVIRNGKLGIGVGVNVPYLDFTLASGKWICWDASGGSGSRRWAIGNDILGDGDWTLYRTTANNGSLNTPVLYSDNASHFGIFNNAPVSALDVTGDIRASTTSAATNGFISMASNKAAPTAITIGTSPVNFTNTAGVNIMVYVDAVSVTGTVGLNGTTIFTTIGQNTVSLQPNEWVTLTFTIGVPTAKWKAF